MFAGVGPLAIRAAKKGAIVISNDLNPACYEWIKHNAFKNKITQNFHAFNMDAR